MRLQWIAVGVMTVLLAGCPSTQQQQHVQQPAGPAKDVLGAEPHYEPLHPSANNDYVYNGQQYNIVRDPASFSELGYAAIYGTESNGDMTSIGERVNSSELTASHPTLPIPSYARITNMTNNRMMIVRINNRGPYKPGKQIGLSRAAADRLNLLPTSRVRIDPVIVSPDGELSGPGTVGSNIIKQSYALPSRPQLGQTSALGTPVYNEAPMPENSRPVPQPKTESVSVIQSPTENTKTISETNNSFAENVASENTQPAVTATAVQTPEAVSTSSTAVQSGYMVQVGAIGDESKAQEWQRDLSDKLRVSGRVEAYGDVYRVQLGPFNDKNQATQVKNQLQQQLKQNSFIIAP